MPEFLLEIRSGEIPANMQIPAAEQLKKSLATKLQTCNLEHGDISTYVTPNRLVAVVKELSALQQEQVIEQKGPRVNAPEQAITGFLKSVNKNIDQLEKRTTDKGEFFFNVETIPATATNKILPGIIEQIIKEFQWPKSMKWGTSIHSWIRPIHGICAVFDNQPITFALNLSDASAKDPVIVKSTNTTRGHQSLSNNTIIVNNFNDYKKQLAEHYVIMDHHERKTIILRQINAICTKHKLVLKPDESLLNEVVGLVEYPNCLIGNIEKKFMMLPPEVLQTSMKVHQRYFSLHTQDNKTAPYFIVVANLITNDNCVQIISGNETVLNARLSDALFFYNQDLQQSIKQNTEKLKNIVFHAKLGSMYDKQTRIASTIKTLQTKCSSNDIESAVQAAKLCKTDLVSNMVYEFPELQGIMGGYYMTEKGSKVSTAIRNQYLPKGPADKIPDDSPSKLLCIADKLDTLKSFFDINIKPTGSKDPFALRRAAIGLIRICETFDCTINLHDCRNNGLYEFIVDRLKVYLKDQDISSDVVETALLDNTNSMNIYLIKQKILDIQSIIKHHPNLLSSFKRIHNILEKSNVTGTQKINLDLFESDDEIYLDKIVTELSLQDDFITQSVKIIKPINQFLDNVVINHSNDNIRNNRLALLMKVKEYFFSFARFNHLVTSV